MNKLTFSLTFVAALLTAGSASAQLGQPSPAPDTLILAESLNFETGNSSNFQSMIIQLLDEYYTTGPCEAANDWETCDDLRFGFAINAGYHCDDTTITNNNLTDREGPLTWFNTPAEDAYNALGNPIAGGPAVKERAQGIHTERNGASRTYCNDNTFINHDTGLHRAWELTFPGLTSATDAALDDYWERPHLNFFMIKNLPSGGDSEGRVLRSLQTACDMFLGLPVVDDNGTGTTTDDIVVGNLPAMPSWVLAERSANSDAHIYAGMVSAAGGTGECQIKQGNNWSTLNMCEYVNSGVTESTLRDGIASGSGNNTSNGAYRCGAISDPNKSSFGVGGLEASTLPGMRCALSGTLQGQCNNNNEPTDLLGLFKCVRQLPRGVTAPAPGPDNDYVVRYCPNGLPDDGDIIDDDCIILRESQGDIQFIDDNRTLFIITNRNYCQGGSVQTFECPTNQACDTGGVGRCADGSIVCPDGQPVCKPQFEDYPEICNGLDDDCDGKVDNLSQSWNSPLYTSYVLPVPEHAGKACNELDVCMCPGGATDLKAGGTFEEYLDAWGGACMCGEGLEPNSTPLPDDDGPMAPADSNSACSAVSSDAIPFSFVALAMLGIVGMVRRRR